MRGMAGLALRLADLITASRGWWIWRKPNGLMTPKAALGADARRKEVSTEQPGREMWRHG